MTQLAKNLMNHQLLNELDPAVLFLIQRRQSCDPLGHVSTKENQKVYIMGESGKNQALPMRDQGMTLSDALGESLGLNPSVERTCINFMGCYGAFNALKFADYICKAQINPKTKTSVPLISLKVAVNSLTVPCITFLYILNM